MDYNKELAELIHFYNEHEYEKLMQRLAELDETIISFPFMILLDLDNDNFEEAKNVANNFDLTKYYKEEYDVVLKFICEIVFRVGCVDKIKEICEYFYSKTGLEESLYAYFNAKVSFSENLSQCKEVIEKIIETTNEYSKFNLKTQYFIFEYFYLEENYEKIFEMALNTDEKFLYETNLFYKTTLLAFKNSNYNFVVDFYEKMKDFITFDSLDDFRWLSLCIQSKEFLLMEITYDELEKLERYIFGIIDNYKSFSKYSNTYEFKTETIELVKVLENKKVDITFPIVKILKNLIDGDYKKAVDVIIEENYKAEALVRFSYDLRSYNKNIVKEILDYILELLNDNVNNISYYIYFGSLKTTIDEKHLEDFEYLLKGINLEEKIRYINVELERCALKINTRYYLYYFGRGLLNVSTNEEVTLYAKTFLMAWYYVQNDKNNFITLYEEIGSKIDFWYSQLMTFINPLNSDLFKYLLDKKDENLASHYSDSLTDYLFTTNGVKPDLETAGKAVSVLDELFAENGDNLSVSEVCFKAKKGIYKYYLGEIKESEDLIKESAYKSLEHCNCGVAALLTLNEFKYAEKALEINKKIVLNSINGLKLVGEDEYIEAEFDNHLGIYKYYAYYALLGDEDFDIKLAYQNLVNYSYEDVQSCYFIVKLALELELEYVVEAYRGKLNLFKAEGVIDHDLKYLEIIENDNCPLYKPQRFYKELFSFIM